jgi:hypothetical protein
MSRSRPHEQAGPWVTLWEKARDLGLNSECSAEEARAFKFSKRGASSSLEDCSPMISATVAAVAAAPASLLMEIEGREWAVAGRVRVGRAWSVESRTEGEGARARADDGRGGKAAEAAALAEAGNCTGRRVRARMDTGAHTYQSVGFSTSC